MSGMLRKNGLSIAFFILFIAALFGQWLTGYKTYNKEQLEEGKPVVDLKTYSTSGHFIQATFENWESEFLQMALFVILTISLRQKGSSESKKLEGEEEVDRNPDPRKKDAPWQYGREAWR